MCLGIFISLAVSQTLTTRYEAYGTMFVPQFSSAPFPDSLRKEGHTYNGTLFSRDEHYTDSSVAIFVPKGFHSGSATDMVVYFHGWNNNIDSACAQFHLIEQFTGAKKNAIFVFPEGPKNAPDSYGGKMELKDGLQRLVADVLTYLKNKNIVPSTDVGNIVLAGHSGAYRVISFCVMRGGLTDNISDVILFDALYGQTEKFAYWIDHYNGRFVDIYTDSGGTKNESLSLMADLDAWKIPYYSTEENDLTAHDLTDNKRIFIHSALTHNEVVGSRQQFRKFLQTSGLKGL